MKVAWLIACLISGIAIEPAASQTSPSTRNIRPSDVGIQTPISPGNVIVGGPSANQLSDSGAPLANMALSGYYGAMNVNGDMTIDQLHEGTAYTNTNCGASVTNQPIMDGWGCAYTNFWGSTTQQISTDAPAGYKYSLKLTGAAGITIAATQTESLISSVDGTTLQGLGWGASGASSVLFEFCAKASQGGTYAAYIQNNGKSETYIQQYTLAAANAWQCFSNVVIGPTAGTWATVTGTGNVFRLGFDLGSGSNFQGTAGWNAANVVSVAGDVAVRQTTGATLQVAAVHLRPLSTAGVPYQPRTFAAEMQLAQRFVRKSFPVGTVPAQNAGLAGARCVTNPVASGRPSVFEKIDLPMQGTPTVLTYNPSAANANWRDVTAAADVTVTVDPSTAKGQTGFEISTGATVTTIGDDLCIHYLAISQ